MRVDSDNPDVVRLVTTIADTVEAAGGYLHPELVVHHEGANLWLSVPREANPFADVDLDRPHPDAPDIMVIPADIHIPVTDLDWVHSDEHLAYAADTDHLTSHQQTILDAMVELFNTIDKVRVVGQSYVQSSVESDPQLLALIRQARPHYRPVPDDTALPNSPAHIVMRSRLRSETGEGDAGPTGFFMPMMDMFNHHPHGSRYDRTDAGDWRIRLHHPTTTDQVYLRYNQADALGLALGLGYFEPDTQFVSSVACTARLEQVGTVRVTGVSGQRRKIATPSLTREPDGLTMRALILEPSRRSALQSILAMPVRALNPTMTADQAAESVDAFLAEVVEHNVDYFERLAQLCAQEQQRYPLRAMLAAVAARQLEILALWGSEG